MLVLIVCFSSLLKGEQSLSLRVFDKCYFYVIFITLLFIKSIIFPSILLILFYFYIFLFIFLDLKEWEDLEQNENIFVQKKRLRIQTNERQWDLKRADKIWVRSLVPWASKRFLLPKGEKTYLSVGKDTRD